MEVESMIKKRKEHRFRRVLSGVLAGVMSTTLLQCFPVGAENVIEKYPYTMFAASDAEGAITVNAGNFCVNGNVATNGTIVSSGNMNINGTRSEQVAEEMLYIFKKLNYMYFSGADVEIYTDDYSYEDININIDDPMNVQGDLTLTGNINLTTAIKAADDVMLNGEVKNTNESVICSENGDIVIDSANVNLNGLVYAPNGNVQITAQNLNMNSVVIMAQTITVNAPSVNANYSNSIAEFVGTKSEVDFELSAFGEYSSESNSINIFWTSTIPRGSYEIQVSDDNITYTTIDVVEESNSYDYLIAEEFAKRYFKVTETTYYGEVLSTLPFVAEKAGDGYVIQFLDTDEDGIPDVFEGNYSTDPMNPDTDNDGLSDFEEIYLIQTDPNVWDSVNEGMSDAEIDCDGDGISNINEIAAGTNPLKIDTDEDGLSDSDENNLYGTNPLLYDTDEDGISDGSEVKMGLSPTNPATYGTSDSEYQVEQSILPDSEVFAEINTADSPYKLSLDLKTNKFAEDEVYVYQSGYSSSIENDALLGKSVEVAINDSCNFSDIVLKYKIEEVYIENAVGTYAEYEEFQGIKRFNVFKFFDEINMLLPIETQYDTENNTVYAKIDECGTYCVMDMEIWLDKLTAELGNDQEDDENVETVSAYSLRTVSDGETTTLSETETDSTQLSVNAFLDIVFMVQTSGNNIRAYSSQINAIKGFSKYIFANFSNVNVYIIECDVNSARLLQTGYGSECFTDNDSLNIALNAISYTFTNEQCQSHNAFSLLFNNISLRNNECAYIYNFINGNTRFDENLDPIEISERSIGIYSQIMSEGYYTENATGYIGKVLSAIQAMGGLNIPTDSSTTAKLIDHLNENTQPKPTKYNALIGTNWKTVVLDDQLNADNGVNSDTDTLTDWQEVDTTKLIWIDDTTFELPTLEECLSELDEKDKNSIHSVFTQKIDNNPLTKYGFYNSMLVLPALSNPNEEDTDGDRLNDDIDFDPIVVNFNYYGDLTSKVFQQTDDWLNEIMPPLYQENGTLITIYNCNCRETYQYYINVIWPIRFNDMLQNDYTAVAGNVNYLKRVEYEKWLYDTYSTALEETCKKAIKSTANQLKYELTHLDETLFKAICQTIGGNFYNEVTLTGTACQIALGFTPVDFVADLRDVAYDLNHWEFNWQCAGRLGVDSIGLVPVIGALKYTDELKALAKLSPEDADTFIKNALPELLDESGNIVKNSDEKIQALKATLTSMNVEEVARITGLLKQYELTHLLTDDKLIKAIVKLEDEQVNAFLTVASKQGKKFFEVLENCDGYLDEVIELTVKYGEEFSNDLLYYYGKNSLQGIEILVKRAKCSNIIQIKNVSDSGFLNFIDECRLKLPKWAQNPNDSGNFACCKADIENIEKTDYFAYSSIQTPTASTDPNISSLPTNSPFTPLQVDKNNIIVSADKQYTRNVDSEFKILSDLQSHLKTNYDASGSIMLYTKYKPCMSCDSVISQFSAMYPNINITIVYSIY